MSGAPVDLITISREYGAGGSELAQALGARLRWYVLDRQLIHEVAERLRIDERAAEEIDEHPPRFMALLSSALLITPPESPVGMNTSDILHPDDAAAAARIAMVEAAQKPPTIIVGHGGQCLFHGRPHTLHLRLVAPLEDRIRRVCGRRGCDESAAAAEARRMDADRVAYVRRYFTRDLRDPLLYDLEINTGRVQIAEAVHLLAGLVESRGASEVHDAGGAASKPGSSAA
jgi:hypothetical protein